MKTIDIPENILNFLGSHDGVNLAINYNSASADYGYAHIMHRNVVISILTRTCQRCGYDPLWKPNDDDSKCRRHTYSNFRYDEVFAWDSRYTLSLEKCFEEWQNQQKPYSAVKPMTFGKLSW